MNYIDFEKVMNTRNLSTTEVIIAEMSANLKKLSDGVSALVDEVERQRAENERLQHQIDMVYCDLAPEVELIEEMAKGDATKREELLDLYRHMGGDYICDLYSQWSTDDKSD